MRPRGPFVFLAALLVAFLANRAFAVAPPPPPARPLSAVRPPAEERLHIPPPASVPTFDSSEVVTTMLLPKIDASTFPEPLPEPSPAEKKKKKKAPILVTGDQLEVLTQDNYLVTGNVVVTQNKRRVFCKRGTWNEKTGLTQALDMVRIDDPKFKMQCDRVDSQTKENYSIFTGNVRIESDTMRAFAQKGHYFEQEERMVLLGNPITQNKESPPNQIRGERITYFMKTNQAEVHKNVDIILQPKTKGPSATLTHIKSDLMRVLPDGSYQVDGNLRCTKKDMLLTADKGLYDDTREITEVFGNVKVETQTYTLTSGYLKSWAKEDRTIANVNPRMVKVVNRTKRDKPDAAGKSPKKTKGLRVGKGNPDAARKKGETDEVEAGAPAQDRIVLTADEIEAFEGGDHIKGRGHVHLEQTPYLGDDVESGEVQATATVDCEIIEIFAKEQKTLSKVNVVMKTTDITAYGDQAIYYEETPEREEELIIWGNARADQRRKSGGTPNSVRGKVIHYFPKDEQTVIEGQVSAQVYQREEEHEFPELTAEVALAKTGEVGLAKTAEVGLGKTAEVRVTGTGTAPVGIVPKPAKPTGVVPKPPGASGTVPKPAAPPAVAPKAPSPFLPRRSGP